MDEKIVQEILHELFTSLEAVETQSSALLQFVKDKGIATDDELAPYLERAGNASGVRWLAARVRIEHLIAGAMKAAETGAKKETPEAQDKSKEVNEAAVKKSKGSETGQADGTGNQDSATGNQDSAKGESQVGEGDRPGAEDHDQAIEAKKMANQDIAPNAA
ncbi:MAG: hypothetical protein WAL56_03125 [Candidatus Sulfotelmatobacter sp.]